jgi:hypothetical protein
MSGTFNRSILFFHELAFVVVIVVVPSGGRKKTENDNIEYLAGELLFVFLSS